MYPRRAFFPTSAVTPEWADAFVGAVASLEAKLIRSKKGDRVLQLLWPGLSNLGFSVEHTLNAYGERGEGYKQMRVDAWHAQLGVVVEIEGASSAGGYAVYRDLIRASLIPEAKYLAIAVPTIRERSTKRQKRLKGKHFAEANQLLKMIFTRTSRLRLPLEGVLLVGY